mmetsp:Transcript_47357/g.90406  ORF Transcript_47357/g.90406 Transcript_47357/m.90406 type:complete len:256 (-) Transcript_47357:317-1084(-)
MGAASAVLSVGQFFSTAAMRDVSPVTTATMPPWAWHSLLARISSEANNSMSSLPVEDTPPASRSAGAATAVMSSTTTTPPLASEKSLSSSSCVRDMLCAWKTSWRCGVSSLHERTRVLSKLESMLPTTLAVVVRPEPALPTMQTFCGLSARPPAEARRSFTSSAFLSPTTRSFTPCTPTSPNSARSHFSPRRCSSFPAFGGGALPDGGSFPDRRRAAIGAAALGDGSREVGGGMGGRGCKSLCDTKIPCPPTHLK